jgi:hypothetical protein
MSSLHRKFNRSTATIFRVLKDAGINTLKDLKEQGRRRRQYTIIEDYFENIDSADKAYILGMIYADGNLYKSKSTPQVRLKITDIDLLETIKVKMGCNRPLLEDKKIKPHHKERRVLIFTSEKMVGDLVSIGCNFRKTFDLKMPNLQQVYIPDFIRGYFDGDGCIYVGRQLHRNSLVAEIKIVATVDMCESFKEYLSDFNIMSHYEPDKRHSSSVVQYLRIRDKRSIIEFYKLIYRNIDNCIYLKRKYDKFIYFTNYIENGFI